MILDNVPSFRGSIPREVRIFLKQNLKLEMQSMQKSWQRVDLWYETNVQQEAPRAWKIFVLRILVRKRFGNKIRPVWNIFLTKLSAPSIVGT